MSNRKCQKNKTFRDEVPMITIDAPAKKPIGDWSLISTVAAMATRICFGLRTLGVEQQGALLTSTSFVYFMSFFGPRES